jgi:N-methylhydantoinase B
VEKGGVLTAAEGTVMSYSCDRARSVTWGIEGGLPSLPHGTWIRRGGEDDPRFLGAMFSGVPMRQGDHFTRPSAGGGGFGDPLERDPGAVLEDVIDEYVSLERARADYGVVIEAADAELGEYVLDEEATARERRRIRESRLAWLEEDPHSVAERYRAGELDVLDVVRRHGVILDWGTGELLERTTRDFRESMRKRTASAWSAGGG